MIRPRLALWAVMALGLAATTASCQQTAAVSNEQILQAVEELRAEVAALKRTVARLEQELAEAKTVPAAPPPVASPTAGASAAPAKAAAKNQCVGTTKAGARCKRSASPGSRYCWQHAGQ